MALTRSDVEHVAYLARLGLAEEELARLEGQLNHILDQYAILARLDTDSIAPTAQTIELENILRDDIVMLKPTEKGIMPEGLEVLPEKDIKDLLEYLSQSKVKP